MYTLTDEEQSYSHPEVVVEPEFCPYKVDYSIVDLPNGESAITQSASDAGTFNFLYTAGLYPLDKSQRVNALFTSETKYATSPSSPVTEPAHFDLTFRNPCVDPDFVSVKKINLPDLDYTINSGSVTYDPHALFVIETTPIDHDFCGLLTIVPTYEGAPLLDQSGPLTYDPASRSFTYESNEESLISEIHSYGLTAQLASYPSTPVVTSTAQIEFNNPCLDPFSFSAEDQTDPSSDKYSGSPINFELTQFSIDPPRCKIDYECVRIERVDGATMPADGLGCSDFVFDGIFNGDSTDGDG